MKNYNLKNLISVFTILFFTIQLSAQIERGTFSLGPSINFFHSAVQDSDISSTSFGLNALPGYYVIENLQVGANVGFSTFSSRSSQIGNSSSSSILLGGRITYMIPLQENLYLPLTTGFDFQSSSFDNGPNFNNNIIRVGAGLEYLVNNKLGARYTMTFNRFNNSTQNIFQGALGIFFYW